MYATSRAYRLDRLVCGIVLFLFRCLLPSLYHHKAWLVTSCASVKRSSSGYQTVRGAVP